MGSVIQQNVGSPELAAAIGGMGQGSGGGGGPVTADMMPTQKNFAKMGEEEGGLPTPEEQKRMIRQQETKAKTDQRILATDKRYEMDLANVERALATAAAQGDVLLTQKYTTMKRELNTKKAKNARESAKMQILSQFSHMLTDPENEAGGIAALHDGWDKYHRDLQDTQFKISGGVFDVLESFRTRGGSESLYGPESALEEGARKGEALLAPDKASREHQALIEGAKTEAYVEMMHGEGGNALFGMGGVVEKATKLFMEGRDGNRAAMNAAIDGYLGGLMQATAIGLQPGGKSEEGKAAQQMAWEKAGKGLRTLRNLGVTDLEIDALLDGLGAYGESINENLQSEVDQRIAASPQGTDIERAKVLQEMEAANPSKWAEFHVMGLMEGQARALHSYLGDDALRVADQQEKYLDNGGRDDVIDTVTQILQEGGGIKAIMELIKHEPQELQDEIKRRLASNYASTGASAMAAMSKHPDLPSLAEDEDIVAMLGQGTDFAQQGMQDAVAFAEALGVEADELATMEKADNAAVQQLFAQWKMDQLDRLFSGWDESRLSTTDEWADEMEDLV